VNGFIRKAAVSLAACTALAGLGLAGATAASASTPHAVKNTTEVCGDNCVNLTNEFLDNGEFGAYVENAAKGGAEGFNMRRAGNARTNEDFSGDLTGFVFQYCDNVLNPLGIFSSNGYVCTHYPFAPVFQLEVAPDSNENGLCSGVATAGVSERLSEQPCGLSDGRTLWIGDCTQSVEPSSTTYFPWINGSDAALSNPLVLTVNPDSKVPANVLRVDRENLTGGIVRDTQQFAAVFGATS